MPFYMPLTSAVRDLFFFFIRSLSNPSCLFHFLLALPPLILLFRFPSYFLFLVCLLWLFIFSDFFPSVPLPMTRFWSLAVLYPPRDQRLRQFHKSLTIVEIRPTSIHKTHSAALVSIQFKASPSHSLHCHQIYSTTCTGIVENRVLQSEKSKLYSWSNCFKTCFKISFSSKSLTRLKTHKWSMITLTLICTESHHCQTFSAT